MSEELGKKSPVIIVLIIFIAILGIFVWKSNIKEEAFSWASADDLVLSAEEKKVYQHSAAVVTEGAKNQDAMVTLAQLRDHGGDPEGAITLYQEVLKIDPENLSIWQAIGEIYYSIGNYGKAEDVYQNIVAIDGGYPEGYWKLMQLYQNKLPEKYPGFLETIIRGWEKNPGKDEEFITLLANYYYWAGDKETALKYYQKLLEIRPNDPGVLEATKRLQEIQF